MFQIIQLSTTSMDGNVVVNKSIKKKCFGVPLIKPSEPEAKSELDESMKLLDQIIGT